MFKIPMVYSVIYILYAVALYMFIHNHCVLKQFSKHIYIRLKVYFSLDRYNLTL